MLAGQNGPANLPPPRFEVRLLVAIGKPGALFLALALGTAIFVATAPYTARPTLPILGSPAWTSWYDVYLLVPLLTGLLLVSFSRLGWTQSLVIGSLCVLPMVLGILDSYYWATSAGTYSLRTWQGQFVAGIGVSGLLCGLLIVASRWSWPEWLSGERVRRVLTVGAVVALALAVGEILLRPLTASRVPLDSVGDIGISSWWDGFDLVHGVNPFVSGVPPWGGPLTPPYGPVTALATAPFSWLPPDAGAHAASFLFALLSAYLIFRIVELYNRPMAVPAGLLFLAMPLTPFGLVAGVTPHFVVTFLILASLYFYLKGSTMFAILSGCILALAVLTLYFPVLLLIPFLLFGGTRRPAFLAGFVPVAGVGAYLSLVLLPGRDVAGGISAVTHGGTQFIYYSDVFGRVGGLEVFFGLLVLLSLGCVFAFGTRLTPSNRLMFGVATMLIGLPALIAFTYAPYYLWSVALAIAAIASLPAASGAPVDVGLDRPEPDNPTPSASSTAPGQVRPGTRDPALEVG
jgi:hypothetical protein